MAGNRYEEGMERCCCRRVSSAGLTERKKKILDCEIRAEMFKDTKYPKNRIGWLIGIWLVFLIRRKKNTFLFANL